jgi:hypothetical protein
MGKKWVAAILVIVAFGVVVFLVSVNSNGTSGIVEDEPGGWTWSGDMTRGANGSWIPFRK